tara:strand:- start:933 stop:1271 length:339 start_codon:yes stop_codon:yes gene_type:complete
MRYSLSHKKVTNVETLVGCNKCGCEVARYNDKSLKGVLEEIKLHEEYNHGEWPKHMDKFDRIVFCEMVNEDYSIIQYETTMKEFKVSESGFSSVIDIPSTSELSPRSWGVIK